MPALEIVPADSGGVLRRFIDVPYRLQERDPHFVPPLRRERRELFDTRRHPFFRHAEAAFFLAQRAGRPVPFERWPVVRETLKLRPLAPGISVTDGPMVVSVL